MTSGKLFSILVPEQLVMTVPNILKISKETSGLFLVMFSIRFYLIRAGSPFL